MTDWDWADVESLLPTEKQYSVVKLDYFKPPDDDDAAVKMFEVDDPEEAADSTPERPGTGWMLYDKDGNSQILSTGPEEV